MLQVQPIPATAPTAAAAAAVSELAVNPPPLSQSVKDLVDSLPSSSSISDPPTADVLPTSDHAVSDHAVSDHAVSDHAVSDHAVSDHAVSDHAVTAPLLQINLQRLLDHDPTEQERLWQACCDLGTFHLDLRQGAIVANPDAALQDVPDGVVDGPALLNDVAELMHFGRSIFTLPTEEKQRFAGNDSYYCIGERGLTEALTISKDDLLGVNRGDRLFAFSSLDQEDPRLQLKSFVQHSHAIVTLILTRLNESLDLPPETLPALHRLRGSSSDHVRWMHAPSQLAAPTDDAEGKNLLLDQHTDAGSITILFDHLGGLQILPAPSKDATATASPSPQSWCDVKPLDGHCVVHLGDTLAKLTAGLLRTNLHRVTMPSDVQQPLASVRPRLSLAYHARPEDDVVLKPLEGSARIDAERRTHVAFAGAEHITAKEWSLRRLSDDDDANRL